MINVLITGVGGGGVGEQILKALRLSSLSLRIFGSDTTEISKGKAGVDVFITLPLASSPDYLDTLMRQCKALEVHALFPGSEPELKVLVANRSALTAAGIFLSANSQEVVDICLNKHRTSSFLGTNGFSYPKSFLIRSMEDCETIDTFPLVIKPTTGAGGSTNTFIVQTRQELFFYAGHMLQMHNEFIGQEYVGTKDDEYTVGIVTDFDGRVVSSIALQRIIASGLGCKTSVPNNTGRKELGSRLVISSGISQGRIGKHPKVTAHCEEIAVALGSRGPLNLQCRLVGNRVYVFEINPRHSGTTAMRALAGVNEPELMLRMGILNESVARIESVAEGWMLRGLEEAFIIA